MNFVPSNLPRSQNLKPIYRETSGVYVFTKAAYQAYYCRIGKKPLVKEAFKEAVNINNPEDFDLAAVLLTLNL